MLLKKEADEIISTVTRQRLKALCPCCQQIFPLSKARLFVGDDFTPQAAAIHTTRREDVITRKAALQERKRKMAPQSEQLAGSVNLGCVMERLAPSLKDFPFHANDCRSLFEPIDYVIFHGLTETGRVNRIVFVDIKTGRARLSQPQQVIKNLVSTGKVNWSTYGREKGR